MSVLIKGMEMPKNCRDCSIFDFCEFELLCAPFAEYSLCFSKRERHIDCPLVEVHDEPWKIWSGAKDTRTLNGVVHCADCKFYDCVTYKSRGLMYCKKYDVTAGLCGDYQICVEYQSNFNDILKRKEEEGWVIPNERKTS